MIIKTALSATLALALSASASLAASLFAPTDTIYGGVSDGTNFTVGAAGCCDSGVNQWPSGESPNFAIDGFGQKYLNFAELNSGFVITPGTASIATSLQLWTANDAVARDPASYALYGTNAMLGAGTPGTSYALSDFMLISAGALALPDSRNGGGLTALDDANSQTVSFGNLAAYTSYMLIFPTVKNATDANSMQIAEAQLFGTRVAAVPLPAALPLFLASLGGLGIAARRKRKA